MVIYLDSAIIVKLLVREPDSDWFDRSLAGFSCETSELALTEVRSALLAKERNGHIDSREANASREKFHSMIEAEVIRLHVLNRSVLDRASDIQLSCHPNIALRTLDALHVATCDIHRCGQLATIDIRMRSACEHFAIPLIPAQMHHITTTYHGPR
jgi:predicted nucleic acid-binding protein